MEKCVKSRILLAFSIKRRRKTVKHLASQSEIGLDFVCLFCFGGVGDKVCECGVGCVHTLYT